jgi:CRISPR-associated protein Cas5t
MAISIHVEVPFCAFRPYTSREYQDTYPVPPPSAVYGMLLSLVGVVREDKALHRGAEMALAVARLPQQSTVFRKLRRGEMLEDTRPDYQDLLIDLELWVWLRRGRESGSPTLAEKVLEAISNPISITRFGGLSLGESSYLVNTIVRREPPDQDGIFLQPDTKGFYSMPRWVDYEDAMETRSMRFALVARPLQSGPEGCWVEIP